ncbi:MAG TPA: CHRD domain-containing protein [Ilumatobacteraceae bacterium]|nr:CHRD domain-containing protein [Ilumatobacteraceae bacterium]
MRRVRHVLVGATIGLAAIGTADTAPVTADHAYRATGTIMTGANEVPTVGDADGVGVAGIVINVQRGRICYLLAVDKIAPATLAHIHVGEAGVPGDVVVTLKAPSKGFSAECIAVDKQLAGDIAHNPSGYYVNVHNAEFPAGAVRGQLHDGG